MIPFIMEQMSVDNSCVSTDEVVDYYRQRAKNPHIGLIITEHSYIDKRGKQKAHQMGIDSDDKIEGLRNIVDAVHAENTKIFAQLNFAGAASLREVTGSDLLSAYQS